MRPLNISLFSLAAAPLFLGLCASAAHAQNDTFVQPRPLTQNGKFMPGFGNEAIVRTRYTVTAEGTLEDIEFLGGFGTNPFLENMIKQNMATWTYTPGTVAGTPVAFFNQEFTFAIRVDPNAPPVPMGGPGGPGGRGGPPAAPAEGAAAPAPVDLSNRPPIPLGLSPNVKEQVDVITAIVAEEDYDKALKELDNLERRDLHSVFDYALVHEMKSSILMAKGDTHRALEEAKLATLNAETPQGERGWFLTDEILQNSLRKKFLLAATLRQYGLAWETYEIMDGKFDIPADDQIHRQAQAIRDVLDAPDPLGMLAMISEDVWSHKPTRRIFTVADVDGRLSQITARCERRNLELDYQEGVDWTLPDSLGACTLDFEGRDGTTFTVYEFSE